MEDKLKRVETENQRLHKAFEENMNKSETPRQDFEKHARECNAQHEKVGVEQFYLS